MLSFFRSILDWIRNLFWKEEMELTLVGPSGSGKTTFLNVISTGTFSKDMIPTVGFNMRKVTKGNVNIKVWDIGGQPRFRSMWERYCRGVDVIIFMMDSANIERLEEAKTDLKELLNKPQLKQIPVLLLGNKSDLDEAMSVETLIERMNLDTFEDRLICCHSISCKTKTNLDQSLKWIMNHSKNK